MHGANPQNAFPGEVDKQPCYRSGMRGFFAPIAAASVALLALFAAPATAQDTSGWSIAIHGGAGTIARENMTPEQDAAYRAALQRALDAGAAVLRTSERPTPGLAILHRLVARPNHEAINVDGFESHPTSHPSLLIL